MKDKYLISVIMPIYNAADYLHGSINSILSQDAKNYELILINDGSTDNSLPIIKEYEKKYKNVKVISRENKGILKTRIEGVSKAKGKYILFVDADDALAPNALKIYSNYLSEKDYDIIRGNYELITDNGNVKKIEFDKKEEILKQDYKSKVYFRYLTGPIFNSIWRTLIKKEILKLYADVQISMGEDQALMLSILNNSKNVLVIPDVVYYYRINNMSTTNLKNINKKCKNYNELYSLYLNILIPFFKKMKDEKLLKKAYSKYLRDFNLLYYEIYKIDKKSNEAKEYQNKLFDADLTKEARKILIKKDIKEQKTYIFIKPILENKKKKHSRYMKILRLIKR